MPSPHGWRRRTSRPSSSRPAAPPSNSWCGGFATPSRRKSGNRSRWRATEVDTCQRSGGRSRLACDPLLLPPEGFAEQQEGKQCREHGQREPQQRPPLVVDLCDDRQRERSERRQQPAEQQDRDEVRDPVVLYCAGASDGIRDGECHERCRDRCCDGCLESDCPPDQTTVRRSGAHRNGSVTWNGSDCHLTHLLF